MNLQRSIPLPFLMAILAVGPLSFSGCGLLIGNIRPVDEKSDQYGVADLAKENPSVWSRLSEAQEGAREEDPDKKATEIADVAYQSAKTAAVISLNSSCRPTNETEGADLKALTHQLTYGIGEVSQRVERNLTIQTVPALQTYLQGTMNGNPIALKAVVFKRNTCVYDLLYMAPPAHYAKNEPDFDHFVASLRLK